MSTMQNLRRRFAYDEWANREVLTALRAAATPPPVALDRMAHILSAQYVWFDRVRQQAESRAAPANCGRRTRTPPLPSCRHRDKPRSW